MFRRSNAKKSEEVLCLLIKAGGRSDRQLEVLLHSGGLRDSTPYNSYTRAFGLLLFCSFDVSWPCGDDKVFAVGTNAKKVAPNTQGIYSLVSGRAEWKLRVKPEMEVRMKRAGLSPVRALIVISPKSFMSLLAVLVAGLTVSPVLAAPCESLASLKLPNTTITSANTVAAGRYCYF
jgi:hypothetical protein